VFYRSIDQQGFIGATLTGVSNTLLHRVSKLGTVIICNLIDSDLNGIFVGNSSYGSIASMPSYVCTSHSYAQVPY
jgi:hypothetical protein